MKLQYPYQMLQAELWSECLSFLLPNELSEASKVMPLISEIKIEHEKQTKEEEDTDAYAERASHLAILSLVETAEKFWEEEKTKARGPDTKLLELQQLVSEDSSVVGDLFRVISRGSIRNSDPGLGQLSKSQGKKLVFLAADETWQRLYFFLYTLLNEFLIEILYGPRDDPYLEARLIFHENRETVAIALMLVFGIPTFSAPLMSYGERDTVRCLSETCKDLECLSDLRWRIILNRLNSNDLSPNEQLSRSAKKQLAGFAKVELLLRTPHLYRRLRTTERDIEATLQLAEIYENMLNNYQIILNDILRRFQQADGSNIRRFQQADASRRIAETLITNGLFHAETSLLVRVSFPDILPHFFAPNALALDPELVLDFVYMLSIYRNGSFHRQTKNITQFMYKTNSLAQKYARVANRLVAIQDGEETDLGN